MTFVVGPRQCGKTTLARALQERRGSADLYLNWDDLTWRRDLAHHPYGFIDGYRAKTHAWPSAVLDEIQRPVSWARSPEDSPRNKRDALRRVSRWEVRQKWRTYFAASPETDFPKRGPAIRSE